MSAFDVFFFFFLVVVVFVFAIFSCAGECGAEKETLSV